MAIRKHICKNDKNINSQTLAAILPPVTQTFVSTTNMLLEKQNEKAVVIVQEKHQQILL